MKTNNKDYILMPRASTYALGVEALRESYAKGECPLQPVYTRTDGSRIVRPLTIAEDLQARVEDYNTLKNADGSVKTYEERLRLFSRWLDSCTAVACKKRTSKFKIIPQSHRLIEIPSGFAGGFMHIDYEHIEAEEFDSSKSKYNSLLPKEEVVHQPAWLAAAEDDAALLSEYANIVFAVKKQKKAMGFYVRSNTGTDELRALFVDGTINDSLAGGDYSLNGGGSFLQVAPPQKIFTRNKGEKQ